MGGLLILVGLGGLVFGLVNVVRPLGRLRIDTRKQAGWPVGASYVVMIAGGAVSPTVADPDTTVAITTTLSTSTPTTALAALLVTEFRASHEYQALIIWCFHYPELAFDINTLGRWEDAPYGDWGRADEVDRGDYSKHQPYDRVKEKDWTLLPSKGQVDLYLAYLKTYDEMDSGTGDLLEDDDVFAAVADQFDVTSPDVEDAADAVLDWTFNG